MADFLRPPPTPRLPDPENAYNIRFMAALLQTLRLYFTQVSNALSAVLGNNGGVYLQSPYGNFAALSDQTISSPTTAYLIPFATTLLSSGVAVVSGTRITPTFSGIYRMSVVAQFANSDTAIRQASIWFRVNGVDVANSRGEYSVHNSHGGTDGTLAIEQARLLSLTAGDYVEIVWCAEATTVRLAALPAATGPVRPASPAALAKITHVSIS